MNLVFFIITILPILIIKYKKLSILPTFLLLTPTVFLFIKSYDRYSTKSIPSYNENHLINIIQPNIKQEIKWKKFLKLDHHQKLTNLSKLKHNENNLL